MQYLLGDGVLYITLMILLEKCYAWEYWLIHKRKPCKITGVNPFLTGITVCPNSVVGCEGQILQCVAGSGGSVEEASLLQVVPLKGLAGW